MELYYSKHYYPQSQEGSGSAENKGESRDKQKAPKTEISEEERNDIANQTGLKPGDIADVKQTGALSGRDDLAGGSGDGMETTNDDDPTEKF